jgi:hypothetical protein
MIQAQIPMYNYNIEIIKDVQAVMQNNPQGAVISKPVRYGFTTSAILAAIALKKTIMIVAPTNRIINETVFNTDGTAIKVYCNAECEKLKEELDKYPILHSLPILLPNCSECKLFGTCKLMAILHEDSPKVIGITYAKLEAILSSEGDIASKMRAKLFESVDIAMFDESHILSQPGLITVPVETQIPTVQEKYPALQEVIKRWGNLIANSKDSIAEISAKAQISRGQHLSITHSMSKIFRDPEQDDNIIRFKTPKLDICKVWIELKDLAISNEADRKTLMTLNDMASILINHMYAVSYVSTDEGKSGIIYISAGENSKKRAISSFMRSAKKGTQALFVSGSQYEPRPDFLVVYFFN